MINIPSEKEITENRIDLSEVQSKGDKL